MEKVFWETVCVWWFQNQAVARSYRYQQCRKPQYLLLLMSRLCITAFLSNENSRFRNRETAASHIFDCTKYNRYGFAGKEQNRANVVPIIHKTARTYEFV